MMNTAAAAATGAEKATQIFRQTFSEE